ncbi:LysR family transcriptional regulator [Psychromonas ossibalaenae]|uniref:LysR family transcriptional regulator n=1 Tax=Psychromonas ossibalaenae TaxID=444922 RepID=UPI00037A09E8|nr:LysR family transcriptional regulator [Psychromonas ossibalaenae]
MNEINWRAVDLNLLVAFTTLMEQRSVTKAADKLAVGQSAMSHSLSRLRSLLNDPLFSRQGHLMVPSKKALELDPVISRILNQISTEVLSLQEFEPSSFSGTFKIGLTDYAELLFAPLLFDLLAEQASNSQVCFYHVDKGNYQQVFDQHKLDVMIGSISEENKNFSRQFLYTEQHVCLFDHQATGISLPVSMHDYLSVPHALANPGGQLSSQVDAQLAELGLLRQVSATCRSFLTLRHLIRGRKLLCVVPELMAKMDLFSNELHFGKPPVDVPDFDIEMLWQRRNDQHSRSLWLRELVSRAVSAQVLR